MFDPAVAPAVAHAVRDAATRQGNASPAVVEVDHALEDTVPAYQPHGRQGRSDQCPLSPHRRGHGRRPSTDRTILTPEALDFLAALQREFVARRDELLAARKTRRDEVSRTGKARLPAGDAGRSATATGGWLRRRPTWSTAASR